MMSSLGGVTTKIAKTVTQSTGKGTIIVSNSGKMSRVLTSKGGSSGVYYSPGEFSDATKCPKGINGFTIGPCTTVYFSQKDLFGITIKSLKYYINRKQYTAKKYVPNGWLLRVVNTSKIDAIPFDFRNTTSIPNNLQLTEVNADKFAYVNTVTTPYDVSFSDTQSLWQKKVTQQYTPGKSKWSERTLAIAVIGDCSTSLGMSAGSTAGLSIAVVIAVVACAVLVWWLWKSKKNGLQFKK
jgi:hypothetical protein